MHSDAIPIFPPLLQCVQQCDSTARAGANGWPGRSPAVHVTFSCGSPNSPSCQGDNRKRFVDFEQIDIRYLQRQLPHQQVDGPIGAIVNHNGSARMSRSQDFACAAHPSSRLSFDVTIIAAAPS